MFAYFAVQIVRPPDPPAWRERVVECGSPLPLSHTRPFAVPKRQGTGAVQNLAVIPASLLSMDIRRMSRFAHGIDFQAVDGRNKLKPELFRPGSRRKRFKKDFPGLGFARRVPKKSFPSRVFRAVSRKSFFRGVFCRKRSGRDFSGRCFAGSVSKKISPDVVSLETVQKTRRTSEA